MHLCEQNTCFISCIVKKKTSLKKLFRILKMNLSRNKTCFCVLLSYKFFFHPFLITSCLCSSRFAFTSFFHFLFCLTFYFLDPLLLELGFFFTFIFFSFLTTISLWYKKKLFNFLFTCMRYLLMSFCSYICSSVVSFSLFVFSRF